MVDWGDVPTWVGATTTITTAVFAGWVVRIELGRENRRKVAEERAFQADHVAAWEDIRMATAGRESETPEPVAVLVNGSALPIYDVSLTFVVHDRDHRRQLAKFPAERDDVVPPGETVMSRPPRMRLYMARQFARPDAADGPRSIYMAFAVAFTDAAGVRWLRDSDGRLKRQGGPK